MTHAHWPAAEPLQGGPTFVGVLDEVVRADPTKEALRSNGESLTYGELASWTYDVGSWLRHAGIGPGARVAISMTNSIEWIVAFIGASATGALVVPINDESTVEEFDHAVSVAQPDLILLSSSAIGALEGGGFGDAYRIEDGYRVHVGARANVRPEGGFPLRTRDKSGSPPLTSLRNGAPPPLEGEFVCFWTSGSTGKPKGVVLPHAYVEHIWTWTSGVGYTSDDVYLVISKLFGISPVSWGVIGTLAHGGRVVLVDFGADSVVGALADHGVTILQAQQQRWEELRRSPLFEAGKSRFTLRRCTVSGARLSPGYAATLKNEFGVETLVQTYGQTEMFGYATSTLPNDPDEVIEATIGYELPGFEIELRSPETDAVVSEPDLMGELVLRGRSGSKYLTSDGERDVQDADGRFRTGDIGVRRADGRLMILGRVGEVIEVDGEHVSLLEVEAALKSIPGVRWAVAFQDCMDHDVRLAAVIEPEDPHLTAADVESAAKAILAPAKVPAAFRLVKPGTVWPTTSNGKIHRRRVSEELFGVEVAS